MPAPDSPTGGAAAPQEDEDTEESAAIRLHDKFIIVLPISGEGNPQFYRRPGYGTALVLDKPILGTAALNMLRGVLNLAEVEYAKCPIEH